MEEHSKVFGPLYLSMIRVGETGGMLEQTTSQLVSILGREEKIKTGMRNASAYPLFVLTVGFIAVVVILVWVLPGILGTLGDDVILPLPTRMLLGIGEFMRNYGILAVLMAAGGIFGIGWWKNNSGRFFWDSMKLRIPILGSVLLSIAVGRFAKTLGSLTKGGVSILESLAIVRDTLGNELLGKDIDHVAEQVKAGSSLAEPLRESGHFPPLLVQIVSIGEQTGSLDELLLGAAETFDEQADSAINRFIAIFPALVIVFLALIVGFIIAATLMPIVMMELGGAM
jgi:type II secretory pathway component PulF